MPSLFSSRDTSQVNSVHSLWNPPQKSFLVPTSPDTSLRVLWSACPTLRQGPGQHPQDHPVTTQGPRASERPAHAPTPAPPPALPALSLLSMDAPLACTRGLDPRMPNHSSQETGLWHVDGHVTCTAHVAANTQDCIFPVKPGGSGGQRGITHLRSPCLWALEVNQANPRPA